MAFITLQDAAFSYDTGTAVSNLNFSVNKGDYLCVVGENGSGKSTLIKGLLRLIAPSAGTVWYAPALQSNDIGYLPQQTAIQKDFPASVYEVVLSGRLNRRGLRPFYSAGDRAAAQENMELLDIVHLAQKCYRELSGGQQQRVLLARALCATHKVLLLDEPVAGLDPLATVDLYNTIQLIHRQQGVTIIMVSHDIPSAVRYASHILHLKGTQLFYGTKEDYLGSEAGVHFTGGAQNA